MRKVMLPKVILIMLSSSTLDNAVFAIECMEGLLRWLLDEIEDLIKFQKKALPEKSKHFENPRVYFLKILPKPKETQNQNLFKGVRRKFNSTLQNMLESYHSFGFINVHEITTRDKDERFFISPRSGLLSDEGIIQLWDSISQTFKAINNRTKPKAIMKNQQTQWDPKDFEKRRTHSRREYRNLAIRDDENHYDYGYNRKDTYPSNTNYRANSYYY